MEEEFYKYVCNYDMNNFNIKLKYEHSLRVMQLSNKYSKLLGFSEPDIKLATLIGLLHDIGRFEQIKVYNTFDDNKSIDHALYGINELFKKNIIKNYDVSEEDKEIIKFAIYNHNKIDIEKENDERKIMHAKLIRDVDKIDILYFMGYYKEYKIIASDEPVTDEVKEYIYKHESVPKIKRKNSNDKIATTFAFVYDINYDICLEEVKKNIEYYYNAIDKKEIFKDIYEDVIKYIDERINERMRLC